MEKKYGISFTKPQVIYLDNIFTYLIDNKPEELKDKVGILYLAGKFKRKLKKLAKLESKNNMETE